MIVLLHLSLLTKLVVFHVYVVKRVSQNKIKDYKGAINDFSKLIEFDPKEAYAYYNRARSKYFLRDYPGAISDFNKAIKFNPKDLESYVNLGVVKYKMGNLEGACSDWRKASTFGWEKAEATLKDLCQRCEPYKSKTHLKQIKHVVSTFIDPRARRSRQFPIKTYQSKMV